MNALFFGGVIYAATYIFIMDKQLVFFQGAPNKEIILAGLILTAALFFITQRTLGWVMPVSYTHLNLIFHRNKALWDIFSQRLTSITAASCLIDHKAQYSVWRNMDPSKSFP